MGRPKKTHSMDYAFIAKETESTITAVQKAASRGEFNFDNFESVLFYIQGKYFLKEAARLAKITEIAGDVQDAWVRYT